MKQYTVLTLFPEMILQAFSHSILARAQKEGHIHIDAVDIRAFSKNKQKHIDDYPYGGGAGMVMQAQPIYDAYQSIPHEKKGRFIYLSPQGKTFTQKIAQELSEENNIIFPLQEFFDKCILLENRRSEFTYLSGLQDGIEFIKIIEQVKENMSL
mgnify:CR=1 FL=1